jgi:exopolysaccharide production protein ExoZ
MTTARSLSKSPENRTLTAASDGSASGEATTAGKRRTRDSRRLLSIQYARGVAAVSVVFFHACNDASVTRYPEQVLQSGVDLFFAISGFIMWVTTHNSQMGSREFFRRRIIRIVPLYWLFTALAVALAVVAPQLGKRTGALDAVASFLFLPAVNSVTHQAQPVIAPGWTLNHEMLFYVIFALALTLPVKPRFFAVIGANVGLAVIGWLTHGPLLISFYTNPIVLEFVFGVIVGWLYTRGYRLSRRTSLTTVALAALTMVALAAAWGQTATLRVIVWGLPAAIIVLALALTENLRPVAERRHLRLLGDGSYSIYLVHGVLLSAMFSVVNHAGVPKIIMIPIGGPLAVCVGLFVYRYIEKPMTASLKDFRRRTPPAALPVSLAPSEPAGIPVGLAASEPAGLVDPVI